MERVRFGLSGGLSSAQVADIHEAALRILEEVGLACEHGPTVEAVTASGGARFEAGRLKLSRAVVEATIERARVVGRKQRPEARVCVSAPWTCLNIIDMETGAVRPSGAADVVEMLKLAASCNEEGAAPVYPCDLDPRVQVLWLEKACLETTARFTAQLAVHDLEAIKWIRELYAAAGKRYQVGMEFVISPLRLDHLALELYWRFRDDPDVTIGLNLGSLPVGGMTAPLFASGLLAQGVAEGLGGLIVAQRVGAADLDTLPALRVDYGDMRDMTLGYSLPENVMIQVLLRDLAEHFTGRPLDGIYINTNAKGADSFAAADRMAYMLMLGLAGFRDFYLGAGQLSMDELFSPAQFIIDMEIGRYVQRVLDGMAWTAEPEEIARVVAEGVAEGGFVAHATTVETVRSLFDSLLFRRSSVARWRADGGTTVAEEALARARAAIASYRFALPAGVQSDLDRTFAKACRALGVDLSTQPLPER